MSAGTRRSRRAGRLAALFLCLWFFGPHLQAACTRYTEDPLYRVKYVYDGDSLLLEDGTKVRVIGVNTPELGHTGKADEPFAQAAKRLLERMIEKTGRQVRLQNGVEPRDRYGRRLAHLFSPDGLNLAEPLVRTGLGVVIAHPPNLAHLSCLQQAEAAARREGRGLWQHWPLSAAELKRGFRGFAVVSGKVREVRRTRRSLWLNLYGMLSLRIESGDLQQFDGLDPEELDGADVEARGWIVRTTRGLRMRIRHPAALDITLGKGAE